ncbi:MAG: XdhC family protein [Myxococcales bacterium]|nr:XdhC family protein [Myxococcales bacterium]
MKRALLDALIAAHADNRPAVLATDLDGGEQYLLDDPCPPGMDPELHREALARAARGKSGVASRGERQLFVHVLSPRPRLVIVGAVHIAQGLAQMAMMHDYEVVIVDPRKGFASPERFAGVRLVTEWPDRALQELKLDGRTAVVTLTHEPKLDDPALTRALASEAFFVGALGSTRTQHKRLERLRQHGLEEAALARIRGPVGLPLGSITPAEIATSIMAEIVQWRRRGPQPARAPA